MITWDRTRKRPRTNAMLPNQIANSGQDAVNQCRPSLSGRERSRPRGKSTPAAAFPETIVHINSPLADLDYRRVASGIVGNVALIPETVLGSLSLDDETALAPVPKAISSSIANGKAPQNTSLSPAPISLPGARLTAHL